jgi:two-component system NtrC family sensor kinase
VPFSAQKLGERRFTLWIVAGWAVLCLGLALVGYNALRQMDRQALDDATANAERVSRLLIANFERTSDSIDSFLVNFAAAYSPHWSQDEVYRQIRHFDLPNGIVQLSVVDADGLTIATNLSPQRERVDVSDRMHIRVHRENRVAGLYISSPILGRVSNLWTIQFTRAVRDPEGKLEAILVASYDLTDFVSFYSGLNIDREGLIALTGLDGTVRVRSAVQIGYGQDISSSPVFRQVLQARNGRYEAASITDRVERIGYFTTSGRYPFYTLVAFDKASLEQRLATAKVPVIASLFGLAFVLTLAAAGAAWVMRREAAAAARLHHAERLEALGRLTGGIAHDFNNLLTIVMGSLDMLRRAREDRRDRYIDSAVLAIKRSRSLTQQLLAFSRRQTLSPTVSDLNRLIVEMGGILAHSLRGDIAMEFELDPDLWPVSVDADQLQVALINLAVNARDAMPDGGTLMIETKNVPESDEVRLTVRDTGVGMSPEVAARAVEPFYTTKEVGKGTGLGLAQVHGFVHQLGGRLHLDSAPGQGSAVTLVFPRSRAPLTARNTEADADATLPQGLSILVVDDNEEIAALATTALQERGCLTEQAHTADEAMSFLQRRPFDVLLTDIVMPGEMDGVALAKAARLASPGLVAVLMTGYSDRLKRGEIIDTELVLKPFSPQDLIGALMRALEADGRRAGRSPSPARSEIA